MRYTPPVPESEINAYILSAHALRRETRNRCNLKLSLDKMCESVFHHAFASILFGVSGVKLVVFYSF